jgi:hypothetical protein
VFVLQRLRQNLVLLLLGLLPFHALLVTAGTMLLKGPGHAPLFELAVWKEVVLLFVLGIGVVELIPRLSLGKSRASMPHLLILALLLLSLLTYPFLPDDVALKSYAYGFRYDFLPLIAFFVLSLLLWEELFIRRLLAALFIVSIVVAVYGIVSFYLPISFFTALGYSDAHSLYAVSSPLSAFQLVSDTGIRRIQSTFGGPNQFGLYLFLPFAYGLLAIFQPGSFPLTALRLPFPRWKLLESTPLARGLLFTFGIAIAILLTFSRSALIGAAVMAVVASILFKRHTKPVVGTVVLLVVLGTVLGTFLRSPLTTAAHVERPLQALQILLNEPLGRGLGQAGPAHHRTSDACFFFPSDADTSWAKDRNDLCIFTGVKQVLPDPASKSCRCPVIPENWYLQIGIELGVIGLVLYIALLFFILKGLIKLATSNQQLVTCVAALYFLGLLAAGLFLHSFEDSVVAYTVFTLTAIALSKPVNESRSR